MSVKRSHKQSQYSVPQAEALAEMLSYERRNIQKKGLIDEDVQWDIEPFTTAPIATYRHSAIGKLGVPPWWPNYLLIVAILVGLMLAGAHAPRGSMLAGLAESLCIFSALLLMVATMWLCSKLSWGVDYQVSVYPDGYLEWRNGKILRTARWRDVVCSQGQPWDVFMDARILNRASQLCFSFHTWRDGYLQQHSCFLGFAYSSPVGFDMERLQDLRKTFFDALIAARPEIRIQPKVFDMLCLNPATRRYSPWNKAQKALKLCGYITLPLALIFGSWNHFSPAPFYGRDVPEWAAISGMTCLIYCCVLPFVLFDQA